jgi:hypothetical protein
MLPDFFLRRAGRNETGQCRGGGDNCEPNSAAFHSLSSLVPRLDGVWVSLVRPEF